MLQPANGSASMAGVMASASYQLKADWLAIHWLAKLWRLYSMWPFLSVMQLCNVSTIINGNVVMTQYNES